MSTIYLSFLTFSLFIYFSFGQISDKRLCADLECNSPVSLAKTIGRYFRPNKYRLSFERNEDIVIYSKSAGSDESLWGAEIKGERGYVPKNLVRETTKLATPTFLVDTEITNIPRKPEVPLKEVNPTKVKQTFEVTDGTTIYMSAGGEDVGNNQDSIVEKTTKTVDSTKIDNGQNNVESNVFIDIPKTEDLKKIVQPEVANTTQTEVISETGNLNDKLEQDKVVTESRLKSSDDVSSVENVTENTSQSTDSSTDQQKEVTENSEITLITGDIRDANSNEEVNSESTESEDMLREREILSPFSFVSKAIKEVLGEGPDEGNYEEEQIKQKEDDKLDVSDNKSEQQKQFIDSNISNSNQKPNSSFSESNLQNKSERMDSEFITEDAQSSNLKQGILNLSNVVGGNIENIPSFSENLLTTEKSLPVEKPASQDSLNTKSDSAESLKTVIKEEILTDKVTSEVQNNPLVSEKKPTSTESVNDKSDIFNAQLLNIKEESQNLNKIEDDVASSTDNSTVERQDVVSLLSAENPTSSAPVNVDTDAHNSQSLNIKMEDQNFVSTVENNIPTIVENSSVEIISNSKEEPLDVENVPPGNKEDVNIFHAPVDADKNTDLSKDLEITQTDNNDGEKIEDMHQPTESTPHYYDSISREQNNIQDTYFIASQDPIDTKETPNVNVDSVKSTLDHERFQNIHRSDLHVETTEDNENIEEVESTVTETPNIFSYFGHTEDEKRLDNEEIQSSVAEDESVNTNQGGESSGSIYEGDFCTKEDCPNRIESKSSEDFTMSMDILNFNSEIFVYLVTTAVSVIIFLLGHFALDKSRREGPLLVKINKLEKEFLILLKEKEILAQQVENKTNEDQHVDNEEFLNLKQEKEILEEKVQCLEENVQVLEKELENSTEVGLELNRMLSEVLSSENAGQTLMLNIEGLQAQLAEQQGIVSSMKEVLSLKETENHELNLELDIANKKVLDLQTELDKLLSNIIKLEEDKELVEKNTESQMVQLKSTISSLKEQLNSYQKEYARKIEELNNDLSTSEHDLQLKTKEFEGLKSSMQQIKNVKNANTFESLLEVNSIKAELEQLKTECQGHCDRLRKEKEANSVLERKVKSTEEEIGDIKTKFDETDKTRLELETKLQVLTNYFREKEEQLQKELSKYESMWSAKQGEATSTSERIKYLQSEVQNYKAQNETLKQEIVSQEVELKGQISVLEKKVHENWVSARQAERRLEELKQEAAQLRNRLTLRERALQDDRIHNRMQSPLEQSGDLPLSPLHLESPASPPLLYNSRDHITKSPPMLGLPPPFLPPPTGSSFLPPPTGASYLPPAPLPFMPPPPLDMFPGDHRPPPLGRMSSPPLNSRYSPSRPYSPYDRSPSPSYDESEYGTSPDHRRNYSQFNRRRDHRPAAMEKFNGRSGTLSSGSENSNESLDEINHQNSKV